MNLLSYLLNLFLAHSVRPCCPPATSFTTKRVVTRFAGSSPTRDGQMSRAVFFWLMLIHVQSGLLCAAVLRAATTRHYSSNGAVPALRAPIGDVGKALRYAVLLDAENAQHSALPLIMEEIAQFGSAAVRRVYGDFSKPELRPWRQVSLDQSFRPVNAFSYVSGKGSSDSTMIIDAMDLLHTNDAIDGFCLVTSDSDFTGLAQRLREAGKHVIGFGSRHTPAPFVGACERFIYTENLKKSTAPEALASKQVQSLEARGPEPIKKVPKATVQFLRDAVEACAADDGWVYLGHAGAYVAKLKSDFDPRTYGFKKLGQLMKSLPDEFEFRTTRADSSVDVRVARPK